MNKQRFTLGCALLLSGSMLLSSLPARAQNIVICESRNGRTERCAINTRGGIELIEQLSDTSCRGRWSYGRGYVEVRDGCRAKFANYDYYDDDYYDDGYYDGGYYDDNYYDGHYAGGGSRIRITCASRRGHTERCRFPARGRVRLVRQLSNTPCEGNWRYRDGYIIVRNGCRAEFEARR